METTGSLQQHWMSIADTWIELTASGRNAYREGLLDAWMLDAMGDVADCRVLDLGCGEGRFARMLAQRGAEVTGIDFCPQFIDYANAHKSEKECYVLGDMEDLRQFADASFELAVSYVSLVDVPHFERVIREAYRVLQPGGRCVICNLQPMVTAVNHWMKDEDGGKIHFPLDNYFDESEREMRICAGMVINYHRTLSTYLNCFLETGFRLEGIREPKPSLEQSAAYPEVDDNLRVPYFIIYLLRKQGA